MHLWFVAFVVMMSESAVFLRSFLASSSYLLVSTKQYYYYLLLSSTTSSYVAYTAAQYTYLSMSSVMYIIRSVQYFVPSLLIVISLQSVYSLELVEKNVTLLYTAVQRSSVSPQDTCKIFVKF